MTCLSHHHACDCREAAHRAEVEFVTRRFDRWRADLREKCPCESGNPDPCPKCGATVSGDDPVDGVCQAGNLEYALIQENERLRAEVARLRAALEKYGDHRVSCGLYHHLPECTCGLSEALAAGQEVERG